MKKKVCLLIALAWLLLAAGGCQTEEAAPPGSNPEAAPPAGVGETLAGQLAKVAGALAALPAGGEAQAAVAGAEDAIAQLGYTVVNIQKRDTAVLNHQPMLGFFERLKTGEDCLATAYAVRSYAYEGEGAPPVDGYAFGRDKDGLFRYYLSIDGGGYSCSGREALTTLKLTENGNLYADGAGDDDGTGFRVVPLPEECGAAYWKYVWWVDGQSEGVLSRNWGSPADFGALNWDLIFEEIWTRENGAPRFDDEQNPFYTAIQNQYGREDYAAVVPAAVVEGTLRRYFDVDTDTLRSMKDRYRDGEEALLYQPQSNTYRFWGFRGGGYKPQTEVWQVAHNPDGSLSLLIAWSAKDRDSDSLQSVLTVLPEDGGFRYLSNFYCEDKIKQMFSHSLALAASGDEIHRGGFQSAGEPVEQGGYRFGPIDTKSLYGRVNWGGVSTTEDIRRWFKLVFEGEAAEKYLGDIFSVPLYRDGEQGLLVNLDAQGGPIAGGSWDLEDMRVLENTPQRIAVEAGFSGTDGPARRRLELVYSAGEWRLTRSYEG